PYDVLYKENKVIDQYEKSFGYSLDDKLYLALLSNNNQIANAFSTQTPLNMQVDYIGGALHPDYFASKSWLNTLLYHESAHNFQINPKKNLLSRYAHKIFKNSFYNGILIPIFPVPNNLCSPFNLEGNAVLNESWHENGGRLYNGTLLALALTQAKNGYITPQRTYNQHLYFPYESHNYIVGGYFWYYLSQKYGLNRANRYFYNFSGQWIPIFTNNIFKETFGVDYEKAIKDYSKWLKKRAKGFIATKGKTLLRSKNMTKLTKIDNQILFLSSDDRTLPQLNRYDLKTDSLISKKSTLKIGRVFKVGKSYYSLASSYATPTKIKIALYDENGNIYKKSISKAIQYISPDKKDMIYFDINRSFNHPFALHNSKEIGYVNSSIFRDKNGSIYYFKQQKQKRVLYKDNTPVFSFRGWFGFVSDVDKDGIYIIANTKLGSSLFRIKEGKLTRVLAGDDVIDAKLIDQNRAFVESVDGDGVSYKIVKLTPMIDDIYFPKYSFKVNDTLKIASFQKENLQKTSHSYTPISNLHYSATDAMINYTDGSIGYDISIRFRDPLMQNSLSIFATKFDNDSIAGVGYDNMQYRTKFGVGVYGVLDSDVNTSSRDFGFHGYIKYPLFQKMYKKIDTKLSYTLNSDKDAKSPLTLTLSLSDKRVFGHSMYINYGNFLDISYSLDRGESSYGAKSYFARDLGKEWYFNCNLSSAYSNLKKSGKKRGIKINSYQSSLDDALSFVMPSLKDDLYAKSIIKAGAGIKKVLNFDKYFFTFPISLRREAIYAKYNYYNIGFKDDSSGSFNEFTLGLKADMLYFNSLPLPISIEYLYNPDLKNSSDLRVIFDISF
ncbi:MAG: hypothetical protein DSZ06_01565, partial [Sulfurospirillum sp.]